MFSNHCSVNSPGGEVGCVKMVGHQMQGSIECKNTSTGQIWCGYCMDWSCDTHNVVGQPTRTPRSWELERDLAN